MVLKILIVAVLILIGAWFLYKAIYIRVLSKTARQWPVAKGRILSSQVVDDNKRTATGKTSTIFFPEIAYEYTVAGKVLQGNRMTFGNPSYDYLTATRIQEKFHADLELNVYYDPINPSISVLVPYAREALRSYIPGIFFTASGIILALVMIFV